MTPQELLKPRIKFILPYPGSTLFYKEGDILIFENGFYRSGNEIPTPKEHIEKYPHLFKPLHWADERGENDIKYMPKYLKWVGKKVSHLFPNIVKVKEWKMDETGERLYFIWDKEENSAYPTNFEPASLEEYQQQNKPKQEYCKVCGKGEEYCQCEEFCNTCGGFGKHNYGCHEGLD